MSGWDIKNPCLLMWLKKVFLAAHKFAENDGDSWFLSSFCANSPSRGVAIEVESRLISLIPASPSCCYCLYILYIKRWRSTRMESIFWYYCDSIFRLYWYWNWRTRKFGEARVPRNSYGEHRRNSTLKKRNLGVEETLIKPIKRSGHPPGIP